MKTDIENKIERLIHRDIKNLNLSKGDRAEKLWQYRDANFLNGSYDYIFIKYAKEMELTYDYTDDTEM